MTALNGTNVAASIVPFTTDDFFPTHLAKYGQGGWREVATIADRDAITTARREAGMAVYVTSEAKLYILGEDLESWIEFKSGSTDSIRKTSDFSTIEPLFDGEIVQYIGETTEDYIQGYFYKCTIEEESGEEDVYSWEQIDVQPATDLIWGNITGTLSNQTDLQTELDKKVNSNDLATVATSGSYSDLSNKPSINGVTLEGNKTQGELDIRTYSPYPNDFVINQSFKALVNSILHSAGAKQGNAYLGTISGDYMPWGSGAAECKVEYMQNNIAVLTINSADVAPYRWEYNTYSGDYTWKSSILQSKTIPDTWYTENVIIQYIGPTTQDYTNGYFYKCVNGEWIELEVQKVTPVAWGNITGTLSDQTDLQDALDEKQDVLTAGNNITIETVTEAGQTKTVISADIEPDYNFEKIEDYLYYADFDASDEDEAFAIEFFENLLHNKDTVETNAPLRFGGACSSIRKGNFYGRNYDWYYDRKKSFIIHNKPIDGRYESLGVAQSIFLDIDENNVRIIPFLMLDGINEHGLFVNNNVVPTGDMGKTTGTHSDLEGDYICMLMLPRYILDRFTTATEAVTWIQNSAKIYAPYSQTTKIELHFMIGDPNKTYIVEFINNEAVVSDVTGTKQAIMTNFYRQDAEFDETTGHVDFDSVTNYGAGLERYNTLADNYDSVYDMASMRSCIDSVQYTQSYTLIYNDPETRQEVNPNCWKTEFAADYSGSTLLPHPMDLHANSPLEDYVTCGVLDLVYQFYLDRSRDENPAKTWQTVHSCVYDIQKRIINIKVQEENKERYFTFPIKGGYVAGENIIINENIISAVGSKVDDRVRRVSSFPVLPERENEIVQYVGDTTSEFTHGYFYENNFGGVVDEEHTTLAEGQTVEIYDQSAFTEFLDSFPNTASIVIENDNGIDALITHYDANGQPTGSVTTLTLIDGYLTTLGIRFEGVTTLDENTSVKIDYKKDWVQVDVQDRDGGIAEGVENQNPAQYKVNPIYDWVGTLEQYAAQDIETLHPEWVCYITNDGGLPSGGSSSGYVQSVNGETGAVVVDEFSPEDAGAEGNVLVKTATGYTWGEAGSGKTEDENGNLYISDEFAKDWNDEQYPLIYRTKSEDDSNTIKINAPVEIIESPDVGSRSLKVSGSLSAKDTKVKSLTIDGTIRANGNIWMGRHEETFQKIQSENGVIFHKAYYTGESWAWVSEYDDLQYVYSEKEIPEVNDNLYNNYDLTDQYSTVTSSWEGREWVWDSNKASIKEVNEIILHEDDNRGIRNVKKITGLKYYGDNHHMYQWSIDATGNAYFDKISGTKQNSNNYNKPFWRISSDGTFYGGRISLERNDGEYLGNNKMGSLDVHGAIKVYGESTVTGTSHIQGDIKLDPKDSGNGYSRIYPTENETSSLGTPNHRFEKIYVKDIDISGSGGVDVAHLDGVEEINENTLQFTKLAESASGYYNADGQYVGSVVTQYINSEDDLPLVTVGFVGANNITYRYSAKTGSIDSLQSAVYTAWYDKVNDTYVYTFIEDIKVGDHVLRDKEATLLTTVASLIKEPAESAINDGWKYNGEIDNVSEIGVEYPECQGIRISHSSLLANDLVYRFVYNEMNTKRYWYQAKNARASDWSDGLPRQWVCLTNNQSPQPGTTTLYVCDDTTNHTNNIGPCTVYDTERQYIECIKGLTTEGGSNPGDLQLIRRGSGGELTAVFQGQYWNGTQLVNTYAWTDDLYNPRVGDPIYKAISQDPDTFFKTTDVIGTVTEIFRPENSVAINSDTGSTPIHNYTQKHFNYYQASLEEVANSDSIAKFEYGGYFDGNNVKQKVLIDIDSYPQGGVVDSKNSTFAIGQSAYVYNSTAFLSRFSSWPNAKYLVITQNSMYPDNPRAITGTAYDSNNQFLFKNNTTIEPDGMVMWFGVRFIGVTTVDSNTSIKIDIHRTSSTVKYTLDSIASPVVYNTTELIEKSKLTWAYYKGVEYSQGNTYYLWKLAGGRSNSVKGNESNVYITWINSKGVRNPVPTSSSDIASIGDQSKLYMYANGLSKVVTIDGNRPVVRATTTVKAHKWFRNSGGITTEYYTFAKNPELNSYYWSLESWGGIYSQINSNVISTLVPLSVSGIYYLNPTSQYIYYNGINFTECFYHAETSDSVYSDIKLNSYYYWRAIDGSYSLVDGKEHEVVATYDDLPVPNVITLSEYGNNNIFFVRCPENDTSNARAWWDYNEEETLRYTDADINVNHVGDKVYTDGSLTTASGTITNISYTNEDVKVNGLVWTLDLSNTNCNEYFMWDNGEGSALYSRMPNPEVDNSFYWDSNFESEAGTVSEIISGEPKVGTLFELEIYDQQDTSGRYFWTGSDFVEAEKLYKSITLYGENNNLGKPRNPWKNVYAESIESPYGLVSTKEGYLEVNGGRVTNVTEITYNASDYIYTTVNSINFNIISDGTYNDIKPVELTLGYCKWQSTSHDSVVYYTPSATVSVNDVLYSDAELEIDAGSIDSINTIVKTVYTWTNAETGNAVYSTIRQVLVDDEIYDNQMCIRNINQMIVTASNYTDIYKESVILNNDSITLVIRDNNGDVTGSCMLNAAKLNKLEQLLAD